MLHLFPARPVAFPEDMPWVGGGPSPENTAWCILFLLQELPFPCRPHILSPEAICRGAGEQGCERQIPVVGSEAFLPLSLKGHSEIIPVSFDASAEFEEEKKILSWEDKFLKLNES